MEDDVTGYKGKLKFVEHAFQTINKAFTRRWNFLKYMVWGHFSSFFKTIKNLVLALNRNKVIFDISPKHV